MKKDKETAVVEETANAEVVNVNGGTAVELKRSNKVTAYWAGDGVATGVFYKTHDKLLVINSNDAAVIDAGFKMPEGTDEAPITAQQKLEAFRTFLTTNATVFGITYDPVDRRADAFKFPSRYDTDTLKEFSAKILESAVSDVLDSVQKNVVERMIKAGHVAEGTEVAYGLGDGEVSVTEAYGNGGLKYATVKYPVVLDVNGKQETISATVELVSGQLKKPRQFDVTVMTMTGVKTFLIEKGLLPKIEKETPKDEAATETHADATVEAPVEG